VVPLGIDAVAGASVIDVNTGAVTVNVAVPLIPALAAMIVELPMALAVASPPAAIVATPMLEELHDASAVMSFELPSLYFALAENCSVVPAGLV
jgi:hypothetical protein